MIQFTALDLALAWAVDALLGDPRFLSRIHPVVLTGNLVSFLEKILYGGESSARSRFLRGTLLWLLTVGTVLALSLGILFICAKIHPLLGRFACVYLAWTTIATRDLAAHVGRVAASLERGDLGGARRELSMIVGRDTENLPEGEVLRGAFETAAENSSDGIVAPLFYLALGGAFGLGPALGLAYKAVNTLD
ncbi:cobalamin biosynthesis protein, partial [bacterium]